MAEQLREGWTTGACATAAATAALQGMLSGSIPQRITVTLGRGLRHRFAIENGGLTPCPWAAVVKDAGDDPDITHGARICVHLRPSQSPGLRFTAGEGVGTVTRPGLPLAVGEPAINPAPRAMITHNLQRLAGDTPLALEVEIAIENGAALAQQTWNPRLGILGGLSVLGTTGVVKPYSCSAWIHSIQRGIDVLRAAGASHAYAATGKTSEHYLMTHLGAPEHAILDMGDFAGGLFKYLRKHPLPKIILAGGPGKLAKLALGFSDLHSQRSTLVIDDLVQRCAITLPRDPARPATMGQLLAVLDAETTRILAKKVAQLAAHHAQVLCDHAAKVEVHVVHKEGMLMGKY